MSKKMIEIELRCPEGHSEFREREKYTSYNGLPCPQCQRPMHDLGTDNDENEEPDDRSVS